MQITIHSVRFDADQKLLNFINKKVEKLTQFDDELISSDVFLRIENATDKFEDVVDFPIPPFPQTAKTRAFPILTFGSNLT